MTLIPACGYVRGSTDEQLDTLTAQADQERLYAAWKGCTLRHPDGGEDATARDAADLPVALRIADCFVDQGVSGTTPFFERPAVARMLAYMQREGIKALVLAKLDRGFRDALDCLFTVGALSERGIDLHILDIQLDTSTPVGKLVLTIMAAIAEFENRRRRERQLAVNLVRKSQHRRCGTIPYGYRLVEGSTEQLEPDPVEYPWLQTILVEWSAVPANEVARRLNLAGIPSKRGGQWHGPTIGSIRQHSPAQSLAA